MARQYTNQLLELIEQGMLDKDQVILACVNYMSESEVKDMMLANEFIEDENDDEN
jgi:hypothetical protein